MPTEKQLAYWKSMKGHRMSEEAKEKLRKFHLGKQWSLGKKLSEEHKNKVIKALTGRKVSLETRIKIGNANRRLDNKLRGKDSPHWKGGITPENHKIRCSIEYRLWREAVFARDSWTCQKCGEVGGVLNAHHIKRFAKHHELRTSIENGVTLCKSCHKKTHFEEKIK